MTDQHRRLVELADQRLVMVDDLLHAQTRRLLGSRAHLLDVAVLARPLRRRNGEAALAEVVGIVLPAPGGEPGAVDEHQRDPVAIGAGAFHAIPPARVDATDATSPAPQPESPIGTP